MLPNIGGTELVIALLINLAALWCQAHPGASEGPRQGLREFRKGSSGGSAPPYKEPVAHPSNE
jgi:hypothetical protein